MSNPDLNSLAVSTESLQNLLHAMHGLVHYHNSPSPIVSVYESLESEVELLETKLRHISNGLDQDLAKPK